MSIISISGRSKSGKDTVAQVIQYLTLPPHEMADWITFLLEYDNDECNTPWKIRKFADKLKDIVCILIGCTREQLESQEFKSKELGEEWWYFKRVNYEQKDTIYPYLQYKDVGGFKNVKPIKLTPRTILQLLGTDCARDIIHPNIWINSLFSDYKARWRGVDNDVYPDWIITDTRFPNELKTIKDKGGITIRVNRTYFFTKDIGHIMRVDIHDEHPSEKALDNAKFDYTIENDGSIEDLIEKVREILIKEQIIIN